MPWLAASGLFINVNSINLIQPALSEIKSSVNPEAADLTLLLHNAAVFPPRFSLVPPRVQPRCLIGGEKILPGLLPGTGGAKLPLWG